MGFVLKKFMYIALILLSYLIGSIPFGLILSKIFLKKDPRQTGSGNIGATNVLRTGSKKISFLTLLLDFLKGFIIPFLFRDDPMFSAFCGFASIFGHIYPVYLKFKGGKGVATSFGVFLAISPLLFFTMLISWVIAFFITKISSITLFIAIGVNIIILILSCIFKYTSSCLICSPLLFGKNAEFIFIAASILMIISHKDNIKRIKMGKEKKIDLSI